MYNTNLQITESVILPVTDITVISKIVTIQNDSDKTKTDASHPIMRLKNLKIVTPFVKPLQCKEKITSLFL